jgi:hypothetical protein
MQRTIPYAVLAATLASLGTAHTVSAQAAELQFGGGARLESYRFASPDVPGIESISLFSLPFGARAPVAGALSAELAGNFAHGALTRADGSSATLSGLTDTELRLVFPLANERLTLAGIAVLPTGSATQSRDEAEVADIVAAELLPFSISNWGAGGGIGLGSTYRAQAGATSIRAGASYIVGRAFEPLDELRFAYRPGNQLHATFGVEHPLSENARLSLRLGVQHFGDDRLDGTNMYQPGNRIQAVGSYAAQLGPQRTGIAYLGVMHRGEGTALFELAQGAPAQNLIFLGGGMRLPINEIVVMPSVDARIFRSDDGVGQGYLSGLGASAEIPLAAAVLIPSVRARFGTLVMLEDEESGISGFELGLTIRTTAATRAR